MDGESSSLPLDSCSKPDSAVSDSEPWLLASACSELPILDTGGFGNGALNKDGAGVELPTLVGLIPGVGVSGALYLSWL